MISIPSRSFWSAKEHVQVEIFLKHTCLLQTISGSLPPSFIDRLLKLACTECDTPFSSSEIFFHLLLNQSCIWGIEDTHPYFAYCDIVCGKCTKKESVFFSIPSCISDHEYHFYSAFTGTRCETYEPQCPTSVEDSGEKDFKRYDALLGMYLLGLSLY